jgi:hypothetical protein
MASRPQKRALAGNQPAREIALGTSPASRPLAARGADSGRLARALDQVVGHRKGTLVAAGERADVKSGPWMPSAGTPSILYASLSWRALVGLGVDAERLEGLAELGAVDAAGRARSASVGLAESGAAPARGWREHARCSRGQLAHLLQRVVQPSGRTWWRAVKPTGTRRKATSGGSFLTQASSTGSKALQCGHSYQKNSTTSIFLSAGSDTGAGWESLTKWVPSTGAALGRAAPGPAPRPAAPSWIAEVAPVHENPFELWVPVESGGLEFRLQGRSTRTICAFDALASCSLPAGVGLVPRRRGPTARGTPCARTARAR